ncbi:oxidoreductase [Sutcliffiella rhizosphaerae]|uniref:NAD(P)-binding domain-containing protein n=1 Tax=Sutcliffiella rhizosphaerae TaxID=2880967 RepID=A0ABN8A9D1_9BACI|nr:oxidoreductase [Sutcliffiella rhizosphaerae]CAG9620582.1 hypothetical protein BACCIP111883_01351 [Sutcliffiella rhizosphaerae]
MKHERKALLIGATGLIGSFLEKEILGNSNYSTLTTLVRNATNHVHPKLNEVIVSFDNLSNYKEFFHVDDLFIALGTTRKKAGSKANFVKVDLEYVLIAAQLAKISGVKRVAIVSAIGADSNSLFFYNQVKGNMEAAVSELEIPSTYFFRPSLLLGPRNEFRFGEKMGEGMARFMNPLLRGKWKKYQAVHGEDVAKSMVKFLKDARNGRHVVESDLIKQIGAL